MEEHFFFTNEGERIFGVLHRPTKKSRRGFVFCHPFAEERQEAHRVLVNLARLIAKNGFYVLRFDYRGTGDSEGDFGDYDLHAWLSDISKAIEILREKTGVEQVGLLGLRLGATFALLTANKIESVGFLVLWAPILNVKAYLHQFLRGNLAFQMATYRKIKVTREELVNQLLEGKKVNVEGYSLSWKFYTQAIQIDALKDCPTGKLPTLVAEVSGAQIQSDSLPQKLVESPSVHPKSKHFSVDEEPFWLERRCYIPRSEILFEKTIEWVKTVT